MATPRNSVEHRFRVAEYGQDRLFLPRFWLNLVPFGSEGACPPGRQPRGVPVVAAPSRVEGREQAAPLDHVAHLDQAGGRACLCHAAQRIVRVGGVVPGDHQLPFHPGNPRVGARVLVPQPARPRRTRSPLAVLAAPGGLLDLARLLTPICRGQVFSDTAISSFSAIDCS